MPHVTLDTYVVDTLMPDLVGHDRAPSAFLVFLFLYRRSCLRAAAPLDSLDTPKTPLHSDIAGDRHRRGSEDQEQRDQAAYGGAARAQSLDLHRARLSFLIGLG